MKNVFLGLLSPFCRWDYKAMKRWLETIKLNDENNRQLILNELRNGWITEEGWIIILEQVELTGLSSSTIQEWMGDDCFPTHEQWVEIVTATSYINPFINFIVRADWEANGVTDEASFRTSLETPYNWSYGRYQILELPDENEAQATFIIKDFVLEGDKISCEIQGDGNMLDLMNYNVLEIIRLNFSGLQGLYLGSNQITTFNPDGNFSGLQTLDLSSNQINNWTTTAWISALPNGGRAYFFSNATSSNGTAVKTALVAKGWRVYS